MRYPRQSRRRRGAPKSELSGRQLRAVAGMPPPPERLLAWLLALPWLDRLLERLLCRPRLLTGAFTLIGVLLMVWSALSLGRITPDAAATVADAPPAPRDAMLEFISAYNQASALAAAQGRPDLLIPYLAADGPAWRDIQQEYARRAATGEQREATLVRWGVLNTAIQADTAIVETQEQWDVITAVDGRVVNSRRGILTRNRYLLRMEDSAWRIIDVTTTVLVG